MKRRHSIASALLCTAILTGALAMRQPVLRSAVDYAIWRLGTGVRISSAYVTSADARIHYTSYGEGPVLILLHGGLSSELDWLGEIPELAQSFHLIVMDLRGHGKSTLGSQPLTYELMAQDVAAVLDKLHIERADVAGWSDGGNTALLFALDYPQRINRLVAISANFNPGGLHPEAAHELTEPSLTSDIGLNSWLHRLRAPASVPWSAARARVIAMWRRYPQLTTADLGGISAPALVIVGAHDLVELSHATAMANAIPQGRLRVIADIGHAVPRDAPEVVTREMMQFLQEKST